VVEEAGDGLAVHGRLCGVHGTLVIGLGRSRSDPWLE
jgi:hypothetical protein